MRQFAVILALVATVLYPIWVYFGLAYFSPRTLAVLLLATLLLRFFLGASRRKPSDAKSPFGALLLAMALFALMVAVVDQQQLLMWYPVFVSALFLMVFAFSLAFPPTLIERIARLTDPDLPHRAIKYTYKVTAVWCLFFAGNAMVAAYTVLCGSLELWTLYNGLISYLLMGALFAVEWVIRKRVRGS